MTNKLLDAIYAHYDQVSPEVALAQRMQELKDVAEYRKRHLDQIKLWSTPESVALRKEEHEKAAPQAALNGILMSHAIKEAQKTYLPARDKDGPSEFTSKLKITPVYRSNPSWFDRMKAWFK
jgi:hypothetical protein